MTGQISDTVLFRGEAYEVIGIAGPGLFDPFAYGMVPEMIHTACWRGYYAEYRVDGDSIMLDRLTIREQEGKYPALNGILPDAGTEKNEGAAMYRDIRMPVPFSGKLRLAREFIRELYIHMGFQKPSAFRVVLDLTFTGGVLTDVRDRSEDAARIRGRFREKYEQIPPELAQQVIGESFSLDMEELR